MICQFLQVHNTKVSKYADSNHCIANHSSLYLYIAHSHHSSRNQHQCHAKILCCHNGGGNTCYVCWICNPCSWQAHLALCTEGVAKLIHRVIDLSRGQPGCHLPPTCSPCSLFFSPTKQRRLNINAKIRREIVKSKYTFHTHNLLFRNNTMAMERVAQCLRIGVQEDIFVFDQILHFYQYIRVQLG